MEDKIWFRTIEEFKDKLSKKRDIRGFTDEVMSGYFFCLYDMGLADSIIHKDGGESKFFVNKSVFDEQTYNT